MNEEVDFTEAKPVVPNAKKVVEFFAGEAEEQMEKKISNEELLEAYLSFKKTADDIDVTLGKLRQEILDRYKADALDQKKACFKEGSRSVVFTRRNGSVTVDWKKFIEDELSKEALGELLQTVDLAKEGKASSSYVKVGKDVISMEVI